MVGHSRTYPQSKAAGGESEIFPTPDIQGLLLLMTSSLVVWAECSLAGWSVLFGLVAAEENAVQMLSD